MNRDYHPIEATPYTWPLVGHWSNEDTAAIVIDMQRDFLDPKGYFAFLGESNQHLTQSLPKAQQLLAWLRKQNLLIIHTRESHRPELVDLNLNKRLKAEHSAAIGSRGPLGRFLVRGEYGCDFLDEMTPITGEIVIDKPGNSAFYATDLEHILRVQQIRQLIIFGVTTDVCVSSTIREANDRGYDCLLVEDCCGAANASLHQGVLDTMQRENGILGAYCQAKRLVIG
ncbi:cysteine hydrolase family protein [Celerinatantimonas sp. YJH-8]|uniref:cysteine hydrolase family protein n=1 Tax=Celerinatantimonas sp. YJH-8 TaxID=3228714 RepID=UPI0038C37E94